jgi:hypothetical protein
LHEWSCFQKLQCWGIHQNRQRCVNRTRHNGYRCVSSEF